MKDSRMSQTAFAVSLTALNGLIFRKWLSMSFIPLPRCRCTSPPNISEYHLSSVAEIKLAWCRLAKIVGLLIIVKQIDCQCTKITKNLDGSWAE